MTAPKIIRSDIGAPTRGAVFLRYTRKRAKKLLKYGNLNDIIIFEWFYIPKRIFIYDKTRKDKKFFNNSAHRSR